MCSDDTKSGHNLCNIWISITLCPTEFLHLLPDALIKLYVAPSDTIGFFLFGYLASEANWANWCLQETARPVFRNWQFAHSESRWIVFNVDVTSWHCDITYRRVFVSWCCDVTCRRVFASWHCDITCRWVFASWHCDITYRWVFVSWCDVTYTQVFVSWHCDVTYRQCLCHDIVTLRAILLVLA